MIVMKQLSKIFGEIKAIDSVDLEISTGSCFGLLGSNGAGKSSMLRLISGIYQCDGGEIMIDGSSPFDCNAVKERIFFINDETIQFTKITLKELKDFYKPYYPNFSDEIFKKLNDILKLPMDKRLSTFSKGMKRQAVVIIALACCTDYLLLDEAFDGLDPTMRHIVKKMIFDSMSERELTTIISSHNLLEMSELCDTVALLHKGTIVYSNEVGEHDIFKLQCSFKNDVNKEDFDDITILHFERVGQVCYIIARGDEVDIRQKIGKFNPMFIDSMPMTLDEIFIYEMEALGYDQNL